MKHFLIIIGFVLSLGTVAYAMGDTAGRGQSADSIAQQQTAQLAKEAAMQTGMPGITNFTEKKAVKWLYELRDEPNYRTYTYIVTMTGQFIKVCDSVGYGINASIQYSNPERVYHGSGANGRSATFMPQPEPNGLFMPEGLAATYVMCVDAENDDVRAVYVEPEVVVSPFPLDGK
jgi:hypothetical protein